MQKTFHRACTAVKMEGRKTVVIKNILTIAADEVNPNGGFIVGISQEGNPTLIEFDHRKTESVINTLNEATESECLGFEVHKLLMAYRARRNARNGYFNEPELKVLSQRNSDNYSIYPIDGNGNDSLSFDIDTINNLVRGLRQHVDVEVNAIIEYNRTRMSEIAREINDAQQESELWRDVFMDQDGSYMRFDGVEAGVCGELSISDEGWATITITRKDKVFTKSVLLDRQAIHDSLYSLHDEAMADISDSSHA